MVTTSDWHSILSYVKYLRSCEDHAAAAYFEYVAEVCKTFNCTVATPSSFEECRTARKEDDGFRYYQIHGHLPDRSLCKCCFSEDSQSYSPGFDDSCKSTGKRYPRTIFTPIVKESDLNIRVDNDEVLLNYSNFKR